MPQEPVRKTVGTKELAQALDCDPRRSSRRPRPARFRRFVSTRSFVSTRRPSALP